MNNKKLFAFTALLSIMSAASALMPQSVSAATYTPATVRIETGSGTVLDQTVYVSDAGCTVQDTTGTSHVLSGDNALCALDAAAKQNNISYALTYYSGMYGSGFLVSSIGDFTGGMVDSWLYYINYEAPAVGLADYDLKDNDEVLLTFGDWAAVQPLKVNVSTQTVITGQEMTATVQWFSLDWMTGETSTIPGAGATVFFGSTAVTADADGVARFTPTTSGELVVLAKAAGFTQTPRKTVNVYSAETVHVPVTKAERTQQAEEGVQYLKSLITAKNLVNDNPALTQWSAMAFASSGDVSKKIADAVKKYKPESGASSTDISRYILALEAIGADSKNTNGVNYIRVLEDTMVGDQYGGASYCNDDIFAGLALAAADQLKTTSKAKKALIQTMKCVNADGGLGYVIGGTSDVDTTAAWMMFASKMVETPEFAAIIGDQYQKAMDFFRRAQNPDGGWGYEKDATSNSSSTSWVMMGLTSRGHEAKAMLKNKNNGFTYLKKVQKKNGAFAYDTKGTQSEETLNTAYGVIATNLKTLPVNKKVELKTAGAVKAAKIKAAKLKAAAEKKEAAKKAAAKKAAAKKAVSKKSVTKTTSKVTNQ